MERKQVVSIKINPQIYRQLTSEVGQGKVARFVESLIVRELDKQDQKLAQEYQAAAQDKNRWKEAQEWEQAQITDWNNQDDGENN